jgi:N-methylhydantoinase A
VLRDQDAQGRALIGAERITLTNIRSEYTADMQFIGQTHLLRVTLPGPNPDRAELQALFEAAYHARFRVSLPSIRANLVNLNVSVIGQRPGIDLSRLIDPTGRLPHATPRATRQVWFGGPVNTPVYWRDHLPLDPQITGPAIIEQMDTTTIIDPGCHVRGDADGNLIVTVAP